MTGKVIDKRHKNPVINATVFLNNDTSKFKTDEDGTFTIPNLKPGEYTLVITCPEYETYANIWRVYDNSIIIPDINLMSIDELDVVNDKDNVYRDRDLNDFKEVFLGTSENAKQCTILNPEVIFVKYNKILHRLTAFSDEFIEVENKALGYLIKYRLNIFQYMSNGRIYFNGVPQFEELQGSNSEIKKWKKQRRAAYLGSSVHFLKSALANQIDEEGFKVLRMTRKPNPDYKKHINTKFIQSLFKDEPLPIESFIKRTDKRGVFAVTFTDCLYIMYTKKHDSNQIDLPEGSPNYATTIVTFNEQYAFFGADGLITNPESITFEGEWAVSGLANLLPSDYQPENKP